MTNVDLVGISKAFGPSTALSDLHLRIPSGELVCLLGPSGCGKTTALRIIAGFETADAGEVLVDGRDVTQQPTRKRGFGMVFQDYSLFPNMTARANIEFGLKVQRRSSAERISILDRMVSITHLDEHIDKFPHQMSGGQKQRVALARALAMEPRVLLLDEPLSALDAKVREALRDEIRRLQSTLEITTVFVTHDQHEALAIADRVAVMSQGRVEQFARPQELYQYPVNSFVASFIGTMNMIPCTGLPTGQWALLDVRMPGTCEGQAGQSATAAVRPEQLLIHECADGDQHVIGVSFLGAITRLTVDSLDREPGFRLIVDAPSGEVRHLRPGDKVSVTLRSDVDTLVIVGNAEFQGRA